VGIHLDVVGAAFLITAVSCFREERFRLSFLMLAFAVLVKYLALVAVPVFVLELFRKQRGGRGSRSAGWLALRRSLFFLLPAALFLPFIGAGEKLFSQLVIYNRYWEFNGFLYTIAKCFWSSPRWILSGGLFVALLCVYVKRFDFTEKIFLSVLSLLLFFPVLYPWYILWLLPLAILLLHYPVLLLSIVLYISYTVTAFYHMTGIWEEHWVFLLVQYVPFYTAMIFYYYRRRCVQKA